MSGGGGHGRRPKKHVEEEHENHERWLVSYADMVTLLMCLFIVMFAISQVDKNKFAALSSGLADGFGAPMTILEDGVSSNGTALAGAMPAPVDIQSEAVDTSPVDQEARSAAASTIAAEQAAATAREAAGTYDQLDAARDAIAAALEAAGLTDSSQQVINEKGLVVSIVANDIMFDSAKADLLPDGARIVDAIAPTLAGLPNDLDIAGHTNQLPLKAGSRFPSDWELSGARAAAVLTHLSGTDGIDDQRMVATAHSDNEPLVDPSDPRSIELNRRVDIIVEATGSAASNELLPGLEAAGAAEEATAGAAEEAAAGTLAETAPDSGH